MLGTGGVAAGLFIVYYLQTQTQLEEIKSAYTKQESNLKREVEEYRRVFNVNSSDKDGVIQR